jgi:hypothetical protein
MTSAVGLLIVAILILFALAGNRRASIALRVLFWAFIALVFVILAGFAISVW